MGEKKCNCLGSNSPSASKFPGTPAWKPARAGREAGRDPEPAGLAAGLDRAVGRTLPRASRPGSPAWAGSEAGPSPGQQMASRCHPSSSC